MDSKGEKNKLMRDEQGRGCTNGVEDGPKDGLMKDRKKATGETKAESQRGVQTDGKKKRSGISALLAAPVPVARLPSTDEWVKSISGAKVTQLRGLHHSHAHI